MPQSEVKKARRQKTRTRRRIPTGSRYTVGLAPSLASQVATYARTADTSMSKAIVALVRLGLESQEIRRREFFAKFKENPASDDPKRQDQLVDEFRALILGRLVPRGPAGSYTHLRKAGSQRAAALTQFIAANSYVPGPRPFFGGAPGGHSGQYNKEGIVFVLTVSAEKG